MKLEETTGAKQDNISHFLGDYSLLTRNQYACPAREVAAVDYRVRGRFLWLPMNKGGKFLKKLWCYVGGRV